MAHAGKGDKYRDFSVVRTTCGKRYEYSEAKAAAVSPVRAWVYVLIGIEETMYHPGAAWLQGVTPVTRLGTSAKSRKVTRKAKDKRARHQHFTTTPCHRPKAAGMVKAAQRQPACQQDNSAGASIQSAGILEAGGPSAAGRGSSELRGGPSIMTGYSE